jgi:hypothetical protein
LKHNKKLDLVLNELIKYNLVDVLPASSFHLKSRLEDVDIVELNLILKKLEKDGYVERSVLMKDEFFITFDGKVFSENNGYVIQSRKKFLNRFEKLIWIAVGIFLPILAEWIKYKLIGC